LFHFLSITTNFTYLFHQTIVNKHHWNTNMEFSPPNCQKKGEIPRKDKNQIKRKIPISFSDQRPRTPRNPL
jgi:hypothetical protein